MKTTSGHILIAALAGCMLTSLAACQSEDAAARNWRTLYQWAATKTNYDKVQNGMTRAESLKLMGEPDRRYAPYPAEPSVEEWSYEFKAGYGHIVIEFDPNGLVRAKQIGYD